MMSDNRKQDMAPVGSASATEGLRSKTQTRSRDDVMILSIKSHREATKQHLSMGENRKQDKVSACAPTKESPSKQNIKSRHHATIVTIQAHRETTKDHPSTAVTRSGCTTISTS
jgi:hypothetical protein